MSAGNSLPRGSAAPVRSLLRLVVDHNPFYLLSAVCMMAGCLTLTNSTSYSPLRAGQLLALAATLNAYELLLVGLGLYLIVKRGVRRDGLFLLLIEAAFLVDMAFLNAEVYSVRPMLGLLVNAGVFGLAAVKLAGIFRVMKWRMDDGVLGFVLGELAVLFAAAGVFAEAALGEDGRLSPWIMYGAWWAAGVLPVGYVMFVRKGEGLFDRTGDAVRDVMVRVLVVAPLVSLVAHLGTANWVYKLPFYVGNVGPVLVGLGVAMGHSRMRLERRARGQLWLPALGVGLSMGFPDSMVHVMAGPDWSPLRLVLLGAGLAYVDGVRVHGQWTFAYAAGLCAAAFGMGPSVTEMNANTSAAAERTEGWLEWLTPRTGKQWGVMSVVASFVLLGIGFMVSLLKQPVAVELRDDTVVDNT